MTEYVEDRIKVAVATSQRNDFVTNGLKAYRGTLEPLEQILENRTKIRNAKDQWVDSGQLYVDPIPSIPPS